MTFIRSLLFAVTLVLITVPYSLVALATFPLGRHARWRIISGWSRAVTWLARAIAGIRYSVEGLEHLPACPAIILSKHQSAWETIAFQAIFPPHVHVLKRSLLWIPFFGWGLALMSPIAIDRSRGAHALRKLGDLGGARLATGFSIMLFPEGTRTAPGERARYHPGGAWLAVNTGAPVVPVAHNAGMFWGRNAFIKRAGVVRVLVGEAIAPQGMTPEALNRKVETWIESRMRTLGP